MNLNEYQKKALATWGNPTPYPDALCGALGCAGEAGEVADAIKKEYFHQHPRNLAKVLEELGDNLYYIAVTASFYGLDLEEVARFNNEKLANRYPRGFESERSINRIDR